MHDFGIYVGTGKQVDGTSLIDEAAEYLNLDYLCCLYYDTLGVKNKKDIFEGCETEHSPDSSIYLAIVDDNGDQHPLNQF